MKGLSFRIFRIRIDDPIFGEININEIPQFIIDHYNDKKGKIIFEKLNLINDEGKIDEGKKLFFYIKNQDSSPPHSWKRYFAGTGIDFGNIKTEIHDIVGFIFEESRSELISISTGQGYVSFEKFIDFNFPLDIAKKIIQPEVKSGEVKGLTGYLQASVLHFRRPRRIAISEAISSIWTKLTGYIKDEVLSNREFINIFGKQKKIAVIVKSSIEIKKKISTIPKFSKYLDWLLKIYIDTPYPVGNDNPLDFLDSIKKLTKRKHESNIHVLNSEVLKNLKNGNFENFDLCHREHTFYLNADEYQCKYKRNKITVEIPPTIEGLLNGLYNDECELIEFFKKCEINAIHNEFPYQDIIGTFEELLCGEIFYKNKTYFILNKEWYELREDFLKIIQEDFHELFSNKENYVNIQLPVWEEGKSEGDYNKHLKDNKNIVYGDKILSENVELFDLLNWDSENVFIIHVKNGFDVKIRDVASQIFNSAQIIENDIRIGKNLINAHLDKISQKYKLHLSKEEILEKFDMPRIYVLAYGHKKDISKNPQESRSNIAKLEVVQLRDDMRKFENHAQFKIKWIQKV